MIDDDVSTLLKLDERGLHAGGTVQAGSRPVFIASGGVTVNPPDLGSARDTLRGWFEDVRESAAPAAIIAAIPDLAHDVGHALPDLPSAVPDVREAAPAAARNVRGAFLRTAALLGRWTPDARTRSRLARDLEVDARRALHLAPRQRSLLTRLPAPLPVAIALGATILAIGAIAVLAGPERRRRIRDRLLRRTPSTTAAPATIGTTTTRDPIAIPVEPAARPKVLPRPVTRSADRTG